MRILDSEAVLAEALDALVVADPVMGRLLAQGARPPLRKRQAGLEGLAAIIVSQQLSVASAGAIWKRFAERFDVNDPSVIATADEADLRACGLSGPKIRTLRSVCEAIVAGELRIDRLHDLSADEAHSELVRVKGIGPWTADIYLLFCLGNPDAFASGDLALQEGARMAYGLDARPDAKALLELAERWRPWRGAAAKVLWAYYGQQKARTGTPV